jgi:hypothetical protein
MPSRRTKIQPSGPVSMALPVLSLKMTLLSPLVPSPNRNSSPPDTRLRSWRVLPSRRKGDATGGDAAIMSLAAAWNGRKPLSGLSRAPTPEAPPPAGGFAESSSVRT